MIWFLFTLGVIAMLGLAGLAAYCIFLTMVEYNILWTSVEKGWCRIVLKWRDYYRIIGPGLHWIGIPGMYTLYKRKMTFLKSITTEDGVAKAEPHKDEDISSFKTTDYPYAFPFKDEEDSKGVHLYGMLAVIALLEDYKKAFFAGSDWYSIMNSEVMPCFRDTLVQISYDDDIVGRNTDEERVRETFSDRLWKAMNRRKEDKPTEEEKMSVVERLRNLYGILIKSVELRSVDPPPGWRDTTLAPYKAEREKEAAKHQAETSAILFDDTNQALKVWLKDQRDAKKEPTQAQIFAKQNELRQRALAKTSGYQQLDIRGLEGATTAVVGGGGAAGILVGGQGGGKNPATKKKRIEDTTDQEMEDEIKEAEEEG